MFRIKLKPIAALTAAAVFTAGIAAYVYADDPPEYSAYITVVNADTGAVISDADISQITTDGGTETVTLLGATNAGGQLYGTYEAGKITVSASKDGYTTKRDTFYVEETNGNAFQIALTPERFGVKMPEVLIDADDGAGGTTEETVNVTLLVTRVSGSDSVDAWNGGESSIEFSSGADNTLPEGEYTVTNADTGYTHDVTMRIIVDTNGDVTYYNPNGTVIATTINSGGTYSYEDADGAPITETDFLNLYKMKIAKIGDPTYRIQIEDAGVIDSVQTYTAKITLENIAATYGTVGIKYDTEALDFDETTGIVWDPDVVEKMTPHLAYSQAMLAANPAWTGWSDDNGYYIFVWQAGDYGDTVTNDDVLDTTLAPHEIATLTFTLASGKTVADVNSASFGVMRWQDTVEAQEDAVKMTAEYPGDPVLDPLIYYNEYWRDIDDDNDPTIHTSGLPQGRLEASKASTYTSADTTVHHGFFQAAVSGTLAETTPMRFYDVRTIIESDLVTNTVSGTVKAFNPRGDKPVTVRAYKAGDTTAVTGTATLERIYADGQVEYSYTISLADPTDYILVIRKPEHLTYTREFADITAIPHDVELLCGDCNADEHIKIPDRVYLIRYFNQQRPWYYPGSAAFAEFNKADLNGDGRINFFDLHIIKRNMSKTYP